jgi:ferritin-like metal-binding protein YciE
VTDLPAGTAKLIQYLNEAYGTERRLEVALQAHLGLASRTTYKKRLRDHLAETKRHGREVSRRITQLGGSAETIDLPGPDAFGGVAQRAVAGAQRAVAMAQGPMHALRGTGDEEKQLKNAKTEYASEAEEIATYQAIIAVAQSVGDQDTIKLARSILRDEERMLGFLEKEIPRMAGAVVVAEVPRSQRVTKAKGRRRGASAKRSSPRTSSARSGKTASKRSTSRAGASKRSTARRSSSKRSAAGASKRSGSRATASKRASARAGTSRRAGARTSTKRSGSSNARRSSAGGALPPAATPSRPPLVLAR